MDRTVDDLLKGKMRFVNRCLNVPFESKKEDDFLDIQLPVSGCKGLYDSFEKLIKVSCSSCPAMICDNALFLHFFTNSS